MNKHEKEVVKAQLMSEKQTLETIQAVYKKALEDIENKLKISDGKIEVLLKDIDSLTDEQKSILQSQIYQRKFQRSLKSQLEIMLKDLAVNQHGTVSEYLKASYHNGYIGALYNINMQGMPLIMPIDPYLVHRAIEIDSKIKHGLYQNLVDKVDVFKRRIANDISRGIASSTSYHDMATWIRHGTKVSVGQSMRIVRTEGNRIYNAAALDCGKGAKERGCDLVKVWDSTLDMKTRPTHRECDGQVRELDEGFKNSNGEAKAPGQFGIASEDINCRCAVLIKPRWDVDSRFTKRDNQTGELKEFEGVKGYEEFKRRYWKSVDKTSEKGYNKNEEAITSRYMKMSDIIEADIQSDLGELKKKLKSDKRVSAEYYNAVKEKFSHGSNIAKKAFIKYVPQDSILNSEYEGIAYYDNEKKKISMHYFADLMNNRGKAVTWFHEHGHMIDDMAGNISDNDEFRQLLKDDYMSYLKKYGKDHMMDTLDTIHSSISNELLTMREHSAVSDLLNGISDGKIKGVALHEPDYWKKENILCAEAFAHMYEAQFDKKRYTQMEIYFPSALKKFEELLKEVV